MTRLLITGGSGYLGRHLVPIASGTYDSIYTYFKNDRTQLKNGYALDVRDGQAVQLLIDGFQPDVIVHLAGSNRTEDMTSVIVQGAWNIVRGASRVGARLIHLSTDVLFDGRQGPYAEHDRPNPIHSYGRAKEEAERSVATYPDHVIIRTSLIYGLELLDHSTKWVMASLNKGQPVTLYTDQFRNPVWAITLCQAVLELVKNDFRGIINVAGEQPMSRAEFGLKLLDWWDYDHREMLTLGTSDDRWPRDCRLKLDLARKILSTPLYGFDEVLESAGRRN